MKKNLITFLLCSSTFLMGAGINNIAISNIDKEKIAYVDINKLILSSDIIKQANSTREKQAQEMFKWYTAANEDIENQKTQDDKESLIKKYEIQLDQKKKSIKDSYNKEVKKADIQMESAISKKSKELGYTLVFKKDALLFGGEDITAQVLPLIK